MARVRYGIKTLYYAIATDDGNGNLTYATPVHVAGAKSIDLSPAGDSLDEYADNVRWYHEETNQGYDGTLEFEDTAAARVFTQTVLGRTVDTNGLTWENVADVVREFAVMVEFSLTGGNANETGIRFCFLRCVIGRPNLNGATSEASKNIQTNTVNITSMPRISDGAVQTYCESTDTGYANFFSAVPTA